ncbi:MAG: hypothetical protein A2836_02875 [Candidatus Taylorbacteria bacterium RIFCSPHIGHO2_01_FULL_45_63]|uniref:Reverse transcriptase domain-containing protein n=1 Tax=Candidatus Taylorbacteria bacterium RIFCSPHIGHO2_02_FULL_45_35 TaxID=1802311 RepID=A0A1G2MS46_9BACT|nr:MAG: hypothetical protein A2836_02875 [Candidatus Taylorbacteria bacterium RIFCSPHIGHO2_01_FULL_45_63]OHA25831.1 MAG: hypothetical protein A3D56_01070 [Candidatus Taylorbacteria bacterium RIFCSPHIGHO2_02_FULL_45_35]OHA34336.1 MAG: hypothetical protein A3A22_00435 [Candidatus Taylorbacteria bacterium RIFCSPLOWO2_01_FULL_45_34b]
MIQFAHTYNDIISIENLLGAWQEFIKGKRKKKDVQEFQLRLMDNIFSLHQELKDKTYQHEPYKHFKISDPKPRDIHKASVRDRLLHRALYRKLYPFFDRVFATDSYSCRLQKGTHKAVETFRRYFFRVSKNNTKTVWVLKCDIKKFFANIDHFLLYQILDKYIPNKDILWLIQNIVESFCSTNKGIGLPLGNLTSQLLVNIYMNEFDQYVKHNLKIKYYIRYADDFVILSGDKKELKVVLRYIVRYLHEKLKLELHPDKVFIQTVASGVDFLGWVNFPKHRVLRTSTKRRMIKRINENPTPQSIISYIGLLKHGNAYGLQNKISKFLK